MRVEVDSHEIAPGPLSSGTDAAHMYMCIYREKHLTRYTRTSPAERRPSRERKGKPGHDQASAARSTTGQSEVYTTLRIPIPGLPPPVAPPLRVGVSSPRRAAQHTHLLRLRRRRAAWPLQPEGACGRGEVVKTHNIILA